MDRSATLERTTRETAVRVQLDLGGTGKADITTGIPFFDHMLTLFAVHGFFDLSVHAKGDLAVDFHHTVEDVGIVMGDALDRALGEKKGIVRYGFAVTPMDDALAEVAVDLSNRPYLVCRFPEKRSGGAFDTELAVEFFRAFATHGGLNLHINIRYGDNYHHMIEAVFKALGRSLAQAAATDPRIQGVLSSKGAL